MSPTGSTLEKSTLPTDSSRGPARYPFCAPEAPKIIEHRLAFAIPDAYPVSEGRSAGQAIFHAHIHVIPRYDGECPTDC